MLNFKLVDFINYWTSSTSSTKSIFDPERSNTSLHSLTTPSHLVGFRRFGSHPLLSQCRNQARSSLSTSYRSISLLCPAAKLWRISYFPLSTNSQPHASIRRPTRFPTRTLYHFCCATTDE